MASLDCCLLEVPLSSRTKTEITGQFWESNLSPLEEDIDLSGYWEWYAEQCRHALHDHGRHVSARTHRDIVEITQYLKGNLLRYDVRDAIRFKLSAPSPANVEKLLDSSIDLAARLLLMAEFGNFPYGFSGQKQLDWKEGGFKDFIASYFSVPPVLGHESIKLEKTFTARNIRRIAGVDIVWTKNLANHLRMTDDDKSVAIFHCASFLEYQRYSAILPDGFADETIRTLALLFPQSDPGTRKYISKLPDVDRRLTRCGHLKTDDRQIENFVFWRDRLVILKQVFDEARPATLSQWWYDRRNGVQWYTFWVAILVLLLTLTFGIIQCVEGALQVYVALQTSHH